MADTRPAVYVEDDGTVVYRASALDRCSAELVAWRLGETPEPIPEEQQGWMDEGHLHEPDVLSWLEAKGYMCWNTGDAQVPYDLEVIPGVIVRCHPDGLAQVAGKPIVPAWAVEVKSLSRGNFLRGKDYLLEHYSYQFSAEMYATGLPLLLACKNRDTGRKRSEVLNTEPVPLMMLKMKVLAIETAARLGNWPACTGDRYFCRFPWHQPAEEKGGGRRAGHKEVGVGDASSGEVRASPALAHPALAQPEEPGEQTLVHLAGAYAQLRARRAELEEEEKTVRDAILEQMGDRKKVLAGNWKVGVRWQERESVTISRVPVEIMEQLRAQRDPKAVSTSRYAVIAVTPNVSDAQVAGTGYGGNTGMDGSTPTASETSTEPRPDIDTVQQTSSTTPPTPPGSGDRMPMPWEASVTSPGTSGGA